MAGGRGERFWPLGRRDLPKQFLPIASRQSILEDTLQRLYPMFSPERIFVITNQDFVARTRGLLTIPPENVIAEPVRRNTAPCIALALAAIRRKIGRRDDATMVVLPADHVISPVGKFQETLRLAIDQVQNGGLGTIGIVPGYPSTGYGYIECGDEIASRVFQVQSFREKPDRRTAEALIRSGQYKWNAGIFVWRLSAIEAAFQTCAPTLFERLTGWIDATDFEASINATFPDCPNISIDYAVMEKAEHRILVDANFYWNDIGSWSSLHNLYEQDADGNVRRGDVILQNTSGCVVISDPGSLIGVIGVNNLAIIHSGNGLLVCPLSEEEQVKKLLAEIDQHPGWEKYL